MTDRHAQIAEAAWLAGERPKTKAGRRRLLRQLKRFLGALEVIEERDEARAARPGWRPAVVARTPRDAQRLSQIFATESPGTHGGPPPAPAPRHRAPGDTALQAAIHAAKYVENITGKPCRIVHGGRFLGEVSNG